MEHLLKKLFFSSTILFLFYNSPASSQLQEQWRFLYNNGITSGHNPASVVCDSDCNTYLTLRSYVVGQGYNIITVKLDLDGNILWSTTFNGIDNLDDIPSKVIVDTMGNVYICGISNSISGGGDWILLKYNSSGVYQWSRTRNSTSNGFDVINDIALYNNSILVCGNMANRAGIARYSPAGTEYWYNEIFVGTSTFNTEGLKIEVSNQERVLMLARGIDPVGNYQTNIDSFNLQTGQMSSMFYNIPDFIGFDFDLNSNGEVFVLGYSAFTVDELRIYKSSNSPFMPIYNRTCTSDINNLQGCIKVDAQNNIYCTTYDDIDTGPDTNYQFLTIKVNYTGILQWEQYYGNVSSDYGIYMHLTSSINPDIIVCGITTSFNGDKDVSIITYTNNGIMQVSKTSVIDVNSSDDVVKSFYVDQYNNIISAIATGLPGSENTVCVKHIGNQIIPIMQIVNADSIACSGSFTGADYQWYYDNQPLVGENNSSLNVLPYGNGSYYCEVELYCVKYQSDTIAMTSVNLSGDFNSVKNKLEIYPNPSNGYVNLKISSKNIDSDIIIYNQYAQDIIIRSRDELVENDGRISMKLNSGVYIIKYSNQLVKAVVQ